MFLSQNNIVISWFPFFAPQSPCYPPNIRRLRATVELLKSLHRTLHAAVSARALAMVKKVQRCAPSSVREHGEREASEEEARRCRSLVSARALPTIERGARRQDVLRFARAASERFEP